MDASTLKLFAAIMLFSAATFVLPGILAGRTIARRRVTRGIAQFAGAVVGLMLGIGFLIVAG